MPRQESTTQTSNIGLIAGVDAGKTANERALKEFAAVNAANPDAMLDSPSVEEAKDMIEKESLKKRMLNILALEVIQKENLDKVSAAGIDAVLNLYRKAFGHQKTVELLDSFNSETRTRRRPVVAL